MRVELRVTHRLRISISSKLLLGEGDRGFGGVGAGARSKPIKRLH